MIDDDFRIDITHADIQYARRAWLAARGSGAPCDRVQHLFDVYQSLINAQAQQVADDFRRARDA